MREAVVTEGDRKTYYPERWSGPDWIDMALLCLCMGGWGWQPTFMHRETSYGPGVFADNWVWGLVTLLCILRPFVAFHRQKRIPLVALWPDRFELIERRSGWRPSRALTPQAIPYGAIRSLEEKNDRLRVVSADHQTVEVPLLLLKATHRRELLDDLRARVPKEALPA